MRRGKPVPRLQKRGFVLLICLVAQAVALGSLPHATNKRAQSVVPQCGQVTLHAAYLAEQRAGTGSGFFLELLNESHAPISIPEPVPLSVHWYAASSGHWLWRSSTGAGGALVDALRERGPLFSTSTLSVVGITPVWHTVQPDEHYTWDAFAGTDPSMRYHPGCEHCNYPGETQYRAVVAYAYLPETGPSVPVTVLRCGLRSNPVIMPPLPDSQKAHNSVGP